MLKLEISHFWKENEPVVFPHSKKQSKSGGGFNAEVYSSQYLDQLHLW